MRTRWYSLIAIVLLWPLGCGGPIRVNTYPDPPPDLRGYVTYSWISRTVPTTVEEQSIANLDTRVHTAVDANLALKGYLLRPLQAPDMLVSYRTAVNFKQTDSIRDFYDYRQAGGEQAPQDSFGRGFEEASLILELMDARTRQPLWRASASSVIGEKGGGGDRLPEAIRLMLEKLPPAGH